MSNRERREDLLSKIKWQQEDLKNNRETIDAQRQFNKQICDEIFKLMERVGILSNYLDPDSNYVNKSEVVRWYLDDREVIAKNEKETAKLTEAVERITPTVTEAK